MHTPPAPSRRSLDVPAPALIRRALSSPRPPWLTLRDNAAHESNAGALRVEDLGVSPAVFALLRDATRAWAKKNGEPPDPDLYPSGRCLRGLPPGVIRVEVQR